MTFDKILGQALDILRRRGRASYRALKRQFDLDDDYLTDVKDELLCTQSDVVEDGARGLGWTGESLDSARLAPEGAMRSGLSTA